LGDQCPQDAPAIQREGREQVERCDDEVDRASLPDSVRGDERICDGQEDEQCEGHDWTCEGDRQLALISGNVDRGDPTEEAEPDAGHCGSQSPRYQRVAELMEQDRDEHCTEQEEVVAVSRDGKGDRDVDQRPRG
jgi:hypothetical protein